MTGKRQSTVEPVFGILTQFMGLRKINTIGIEQANKVMHLAAMAYTFKTCLPAGRSTRSLHRNWQKPRQKRLVLYFLK
ncbi:transposase [Bizionia argentinensis]|nr:transposase [Bizionia argentinensis]